MYKAQACRYKLEEPCWRVGIAILDIFNYANVKHIVDCESGEIVSEAEIFDYKLINYPFAFCDPGYEE